VRLGPRSTLATVAVVVGDALRRHGVRAVLTGGACASFYTRGGYESRDMGFVVVGGATQATVDRALASVGFRRVRDRFVHPEVPFYVEFPRGPLAIGDDYSIRPAMRATPAGRALMLSATDACRDRLAAFYHWRDRSSLEVAVLIARHHRVDLARIRRWSGAEGFATGFDEFAAEIRRVGKLARRRQGRPQGARHERR
jgi:hypothetical protein